MLIRAVLPAVILAGVTAPASAQDATVGPAFLVGRWGDNGDCTRPVIFRADGTFLTHQGGEGQWSLRGDRLTMSGAQGIIVLRITARGRDRLAIINPDGSRGSSQRCPAAEAKVSSGAPI
ncbi:MAG: hypothetical protein AB7O91_07365 [Sphingomonas sp.]